MNHVDKGDKNVVIQLTLLVNQNDDDDFRDLHARQLLDQCRDWPSVNNAYLATEAPPEHSKVAELVAVGQIVTDIAPVLIKDFINHCKAWLQSSDASRVSIKLADREVEIPADMDPEKLEKLVLALQASSNADQASQ
ncbi:hypothetical protein [Teredinibacter turnerae]|uniref:hypothetical protein n=1 Tax=Teredinibacter turnerae TaxID=2426 RepID=UPI00037EF879|nr:hypothetical protein [Teredinibacter turnerae]